MRRYLVAAMVAAVVGLVVAATGTAARTQDTLTCGDAQYAVTVTSTTNDNSVAWGIAKVSGGDHFIPTSFSGTGVDLTTGQTLFSFSQAKGNGNGMHNQDQITCTTPTQTSTAGDLGIPGVDPTDVIQFSFSATAVHKQ
jgi:hypothetical protein